MRSHPPINFQTLYDSTLGSLRRYIARVLGSHHDAEDIAHDAYARVYEAMDLKWIEHPKAYLFTTAKRLAINHLERGRAAAAPADAGSKIVDFIPAQSPGVERLVMAREEWARIEQAIAALPAGCRQVLLMCKVDRLTHAEISATLGIAVSTVEKQHARAIRLLRKAVAEPCSTVNQAKDGRSAAL